MSMFDMSKKVLTYNIFPCYTHHQASVVQLGLHKQRFTYTANIFDVIVTVFNCVPISIVILLYGLHFIAVPSTVEEL